MQFINIGILFGIIAVGVPIIIHLLNRRSAKFVNWGAIQFLYDSLVSRRRRILMEEVLLLGSRCLLLALVVTAMARPFIPADSRIPWLAVLPMTLLAIVAFGVSFALWEYPRWRKWMLLGSTCLLILAGLLVGFEKWLNLRRFGGLSQRDVALIIDGSQSMSLTVDGVSNFERAKAEAARIMDKSSRRTSFSIVVGGSVPSVKVPSPIADRKELMAVLDEIKPVHGTMKTLDAMGAAAVTLSQGSSASKMILVITDGQSEGWEIDSPARWNFVGRTFERLTTKPQIVLRKLKLPKDVRNVGVADITFSRDVIGIDREVMVNVKVQNTGTEGITPASVKLKIGDKEFTDNTIGQLAAGASETIRFPYHFAKPGSYVVSARVVTNDELPFDDSCSVAANVIGRLNVLIVDGNPAGRFLERAAAFSALALAPSTTAILASQTGGRSGEFLIEPELIDAPGIAGLKSFDKYGVVILANVPRLPSETADALGRFVAAGGGLLVAPGDRSIPDFYNRWTADNAPLLPAQLEKRVVVRSDDDVKPSLTTFNHRALRLVADASRSDIGSVVFTAYWRLKEQQFDQNVSICGRLSNGDPFVAERKIGDGFALMMASSLDPRGSSLVTRYSFLPLIHEMIYYLANPAGFKLNVEPARKLSVRVSGGKSRTTGIPQSGLRGDYYSGVDFNKLAASRLDPCINFDWNAAAPGPGIPREYLSVRWTGRLRADKTEMYTFYAASDDGIRLWIDGKKVAEFWQARAIADTVANVQLEAGKHYDIQVEFYQGHGGAGASLSWSSASTPKQVIPANNLSVVFDAAGAAVQSDVDITGPYGERLNGRISGGREGSIATLESDAIPGMYSIRVPDNFRGALSAVIADDGTVPFSIKRDIEESQLIEIDPADFGLVRKYVELLEAESPENVLEVLAGKIFGQELWRHLAVGALLFVLIEVLLTRWIASQRRLGHETKVEFEELGKPSAAFREQLDKLRMKTGADETQRAVSGGN